MLARSILGGSLTTAPREPTAFDRTAALLAVCHRDIERHLATLERLPGDDGAFRPDAAGAARLREALACFDQALAIHQPDEEIDIFPALLAAAVRPDDRSHAYELVSRLMVEHRGLSALWTQIRPALARIAGNGTAALPAGDLKRFSVLYRTHLEREERELAGLLRLVPVQQLERIARSMAARHARAGLLGPLGS